MQLFTGRNTIAIIPCMNAQITTLNKGKSKGRDKKGRWLPGYCPNENGRPKIEPAVRKMAQGNISEFVICKLAEIAVDENNIYPKECHFLAASMLMDIGWGIYGKKILNRRLKTIDMTIREFIARLVPPKKCITRINEKGKHIDFYDLQLTLAKQELNKRRLNRLIFSHDDLKNPDFLEWIAPRYKEQPRKQKMKHWQPLKKLSYGKGEVQPNSEDVYQKLSYGISKNINYGLYGDKPTMNFLFDQQWNKLFQARVCG